MNVADDTREGRFREYSADTLCAHWHRHNAPEGLVAMLAIGGCLLLGVLTGHEAAGAIAAGGAFTSGFAVFYPVTRSGILSMILCTLGIASATFAGSLSAEWTSAVMVTVAVAGLNYGALSGLGASAGWIGQQSAVYLVIATYFPNGPKLAAGRALMILLGGLLQVLVHVIFRVRGPSVRFRWKCKVAAVRLRQYWHRLPEHVEWSSATFSYALRMVVTMVAATAIYREMHVKNGYWLPMTALLCLKPQWTGTVSRSTARVLGTLAGATVAFGLAHIPGFPHWLVGTLVMVFGFGCYALQAVNYALFSLAITLYIVFLFRFGGFSETQAAHLRLMNTAMGGALALLIDAVWVGIARMGRGSKRSS